MHHTYTNILGKDRDIGYGILRMSEDQEWTALLPRQPGLRDPADDVLPVRRRAARPRGRADRDRQDESRRRSASSSKGIWRKIGRQTLKDYVLFPALTGPVSSDPDRQRTANLVRNVWSFTIIFCGHFPNGVAAFTEEETENETRGQWYVRQMLGSANITGGKLIHVMAGNLSHQIEHHLFPDLPTNRYPEIADRGAGDLRAVRPAVQHGRLGRQFGSVVRKICRLALPGREQSGAGRSSEISLALNVATWTGLMPTGPSVPCSVNQARRDWPDRAASESLLSTSSNAPSTVKTSPLRSLISA